MKTSYTAGELLELMKAEADKTSVTALAHRLGVFQGFTSDVLNGKRAISHNMAESFAREFLDASTVEVERHFLIAG